MWKINRCIKFLCFLSMSLILIELAGCSVTETSPSPTSITENPTSAINSTSATSTTNPSTPQVSISPLSITPTTNVTQSVTPIQTITQTSSSPISSTTPITTSSLQSTTPKPSTTALSTTTTNLPVSPTTTSGTAPPVHPLMQFTSEQLAELNAAYKNASASSVRPQAVGVPLPKSFSLLPDLKYNPVERDQGSEPNCWEWAGTGVMEIALDVDQSIKDRLSIQYFDSNYNGGIIVPGRLDSFANFYATQGIAQFHGLTLMPAIKMVRDQREPVFWQAQ